MVFFKKVYFVEHKTDEKSDIFKKLDLDMWIDDNPKDIKNAVDLGINTYAIQSSVTRYNYREVEKIMNSDKTDLIFPVHNFKEIKLRRKDR